MSSTSKVITGTLIGAAIGGGMAIIGNVIRDNKTQQNKQTILKKYPDLLNHTHILQNLIKVYDVVAQEDFEHLCDDLSKLVKMELEHTGNSMQANRISDKCIKTFRQIESMLRRSGDVRHRLLADDLEGEDFEIACRDIIHNMLLKSPQVR